MIDNLVGNEKGLGWWFNKICLLQSFFGWSEDYVTRRITGAKGWAYVAYAQENQPSLFGGSVVATSPTYIEQEIKRIHERRAKSHIPT